MAGDAHAAGDDTIAPDQVCDPSNLVEGAGASKEKGNACMQRKQYNEATAHYEEAVAIIDKADGFPMLRDDVQRVVQLKSVLFANLAQCLIKQELYRRACEAATQCLNLDANNAKALYRRAVARDALKHFVEALEDIVALELVGAPDPSELARLRASVERRKEEERIRLEEEADESDDDGMVLVELKRKFDEIVEKYNLQDEETAAEIADWLTRGSHGEKTLITVKDLERRWDMDEDDALSFLAWIEAGVKFQNEQKGATEAFAGQ